MAVVTIRCPRSGKFASTGMEAEPSEFDRLGPRIFRMRCSACGSEHLWSRGTAWLTEKPKPPAAPKAEEVGLLEQAHTPTRTQPTKAARIDGDQRRRISDIIERLLR
jgi:hypothetical protein